MAETSLYTHAVALESVDGDSGWQDATAVTDLELDLLVSDVTAGAVTRSTTDVDNSDEGIGTPSAEHQGTVGEGSVGGVPVAGGQPAVEFVLEGKAEDGEVWALWQSGVLDGAPHQYHEGVGPSLGQNQPFPAQVRLRWALGGGSATFQAEVSGR